MIVREVDNQEETVPRGNSLVRISKEMESIYGLIFTRSVACRCSSRWLVSDCE